MASAPLIHIVPRASLLGFLSLALHCTLSVTVRFIFLKCVCSQATPLLKNHHWLPLPTELSTNFSLRQSRPFILCTVLATLVFSCYTPHHACWFLHLECFPPSSFLSIEILLFILQASWWYLLFNEGNASLTASRIKTKKVPSLTYEGLHSWRTLPALLCCPDLSTYVLICLVYIVPAV